MTPQARQDIIRIGCAMVGAAVGNAVVAPVAGGPPLIWAVMGAGAGWIAARLIQRVLTLRRQIKTQADAEANAAPNDAAFAKALTSHSENQQK